MKKVFFTVGVFGFFIGLIIHFLSVSGLNLNEYPFVWALHIGVFIVFIPAIIEINKDKSLKKNKNPIFFLKSIFKNTPNWLSLIVAIVFVYSILNFMLFVNFSEEGVPMIMDGKYVIYNHGEVIREITENEYNKFEANTLRGFSGHWMFFYIFATSVLYPFNKKENQ